MSRQNHTNKYDLKGAQGTVMSKMKKKKEQKRDTILTGAQELFLTEGYVQTSMDNIATKAQVTKQTVYRYFPSKDVLFEATLKSCRENPSDNFSHRCQPYEKCGKDHLREHKTDLLYAGNVQECGDQLVADEETAERARPISDRQEPAGALGCLKGNDRGQHEIDHQEHSVSPARTNRESID